VDLYVLDTSAVFCVLYNEEGTQQVVELLEGTGKTGETRVLLPFMALMELEYGLLRRVPRREAERIMSQVESWPVELRESSREWRHAAAHLKAKAGLSAADAWNASLALLEDAELVHKDPEFEQVAGLKMVSLPYKRSKPA